MSIHWVSPTQQQAVKDGLLPSSHDFTITTTKQERVIVAGLLTLATVELGLVAWAIHWLAS
jgi:hypothetical protein